MSGKMPSLSLVQETPSTLEDPGGNTENEEQEEASQCECTPQAPKASLHSVGSSGVQAPSAAPHAEPLSAAVVPKKVAAPANQKRRKQRKRIINIAFTRYTVIHELAREFGFTIEADNDEVEKFDVFHFLWTDTVLSLPKLIRLRGYQRTNHFPSMGLLCRKSGLGITVGKVRKVFPEHYAFVPKTWTLRSERIQFQKYFAAQPKTKIYIMKPCASCQGKGILLTRDPLAAVQDPDEFIVQEYISRPLLIEGKKFDLRVYVLITSVRHLSVFVYRQGLVRICAEPYVKPNDENMNNHCMHLTNYAVNKRSDQFVFNSDVDRMDIGNKRDFQWMESWILSLGHDPAIMWSRIDHIVCKTIIAAHSQLAHAYNSCFPHQDDGFTIFEVLGFDIMLDDRLKPWVIEVNHTPSFATDTPLDHSIKHSLLAEAWSIVGVDKLDKAKKEVQERERAYHVRRMAGQCSKSAAYDDQQQGSDSCPSPTSATTPSTTCLLSAGPILYPEAAIRRLHQEDRKANNFHRVFPSRDPDKQRVYETLLGGVKDMSSTHMTLSQEQRLQEQKQEREAKALQRVGATARGGIPPSFKPEPQQPPRTPSADDANIRRRRSNAPREQRPRPEASPVSSTVRTQTPPSLPPQHSAVQNEPERVKESMSRRAKYDAIERRRRLMEQMERHRRRIILGPRLSVFQLRESQLESMMFQSDAYAGEVLPLPPYQPSSFTDVRNEVTLPSIGDLLQPLRFQMLREHHQAALTAAAAGAQGTAPQPRAQEVSTRTMHRDEADDAQQQQATRPPNFIRWWGNRQAQPASEAFESGSFGGEEEEEEE